jgi:sterol desaturase/sphingolipid hydroxylase (fatty acid hydroxylase superfamily)
MIVAIVFVFATVMIACERLSHGRRFPLVRGWYARTLVLNLFQVLVTYSLGSVHDRWLLRHRPWSTDGLGVVGGAIVGYLAITFVYYFWHRARHDSRILWRMLHQVHHSPERIEVLTSFYKHPLEIFVNSLLSSVVLYLGVGVGPEAASIAVLLTALAELFYHWNVATPRWIGWFLQRPESHCLHHELGVHARNYADLPLWDALFGTLENPPSFGGRCGFGDERERRLPAMLLFADVNAEREEKSQT